MRTNTVFTAPFAEHIQPDVMADLEAVIAAVNDRKPVDPVIQKRVRDEADRIRESVYQRHGLLEIGVPANRELRDE